MIRKYFSVYFRADGVVTAIRFNALGESLTIDIVHDLLSFLFFSLFKPKLLFMNESKLRLILKIAMPYILSDRT